MGVRIADGDSRAYWAAMTEEAQRAWEDASRYRGPEPVDLGEARIVEPLAIAAPTDPNTPA